MSNSRAVWKPLSGLHESIRRAYEAGELERAYRLVVRSLTETPEDGRLWELRGLIHLGRGEAEESVDALERASLLVPLKPPARVCLGHAYGQIGRVRLSCELLEMLIGDESMSVRLLLQVASGLDAVHAPASAMRACRMAARRDPGRAQIYYDMGYYAARMGANAHMIESLARKAISLDPACVSYRVGLASLLIRQNRPHEALQLVRAFDDQQIRSIRCRCCLERIAELYETSGDEERGRMCRQRCWQLDLNDLESDCCG